MKNLIFFTVGCDPEYIQLTKLCLETILRHNSLDDIDILVMCDEQYSPHVKKLLPSFVKTHITEPNINAMTTSMRKLEIFDFPTIHEYDKILYLDSDIVVLGDIASLFREHLDHDILYVKRESNDFGSLFHGLRLYSDEDLARFKANYQYGFSAGHLMFKNSPSMKEHFRAILRLIHSWTEAFFYEQSFLNHYFMLNGKYNDTLLEDVIDFHYSSYDTIDGLNRNAIIIHFVNFEQDCREKLHNMRFLLNKRLNEQQVTFYESRDDIPNVIHLPPEPKIAEIGVLSGDFSSILLRCNPSELFLIDSYDGDIVSGDADGNNVTMYNGEDTYIGVLERFNRKSNVTVLRAKSDVLKIFPDNYFDLVYIDGDHSFEGVLHDLNLAQKKVKHGGWICGHDIYTNPNKTKNQYDFGVKKAVFEFTFKHSLWVSKYFNDGCVSYAIKNVKSLEQDKQPVATMQSYSYCKAILLTKDENVLIEDFIIYYGYLFGYENIYIVDNGSTSEKVHSIYAKYATKGVKVVVEMQTFAMNHGFMTGYINQLKDSCEWLFPLETDEFIYFCDTPDEAVDRDRIMEYLKSIPKDVTMVKHAKVMNSCPDHRDVAYVQNHYEDPLKDLMHFKEAPQSFEKHFIRAKAFESVMRWEHTYKMSYGTTVQSDVLGLLHYTNTGGQVNYQQSQKIYSGSLDPSSEHYNDYIEEKIDVFLHMKATGFDGMLNGHRIHEYSLYKIREFIVKESLSIKGRLPTLEELRIIEKCCTDAKSINMLLKLMPEDSATRFPGMSDMDLILYIRPTPGAETISTISKTISKLRV